MLQHYLFQPCQVTDRPDTPTGLCISVGVLRSTVWLPDEGSVTVRNSALTFVQDKQVRAIVAGVLSRLPGCPIGFTHSF